MGRRPSGMRARGIRRIGAVVAAVALLVPACGDDVGADLEAARERWIAGGFTDYSMRVTNGCFCGPEWVGPFDVVVVDGQVAEVRFEGSVIDPEDGPAHLFTAEGLFDFVSERIETADAIEVVYSDEGLPISIVVDNIADAVDDEQRITVELTSARPGSGAGS